VRRTAEHINEVPVLIWPIPFDVIRMTGVESVDFLQRITTNDFEKFSTGEIQKTLLVTDKGRILDTVWVHHSGSHLLLIVSSGMAQEVIAFLNKYIIMEDITLENCSNEYSVRFHFDPNRTTMRTDFFGSEVSVELIQKTVLFNDPGKQVEQWRIGQGIPLAKKEIVQDYNPLELNLWDWISFTKGCYIGQEVIARLDTYNKIQRSLCRISAIDTIIEQDLLQSENGDDAGKITSVVHTDAGFIGLAVIRSKFAVEQKQLFTDTTRTAVIIEQVFQKGIHGRN